MTSTATSATLDGVQLAVIRSRFESICRNMMNTVLRTARSGVINGGRDCSCIILSADADLVAMAESVPAHVMVGSDLMAKSMTMFHPELKRGDAFLHNSPYHGNSHTGDTGILVPVIDDDGRHRFTVCCKAHYADIGNALPTTYMPTARDVYAEGALVFPCVKAQVNYEDCEDIIRMCEMRIRVPEQWRGDHLALVGAARIGELQLMALEREAGAETLDRFVEQWLDYSEGQMAAAIRTLPSGRVTVSNAHDPFPGVPAGIPVNVTIEVRAEDATIDVDLRDNVDCQPCGLNLSEACARTAAMIGVFNAVGKSVPLNTGSFRRVKVHLKENSAVGITRHPYSTSTATSNLLDRVAYATQRAFSELGDGIGMAEGGSLYPASWAVISGRDPRSNDKAFVDQFIGPCCTGGPAGPEADGWLMWAHAGNQGLVYRHSVEVNELKHPFRIHAQWIIPDSEGAGRFRGSPGAFCEYGPVDCAMEIAYSADGTLNPPAGARGGGAGLNAAHFVRGADGAVREAPPVAHYELKNEETVISIAPSGGGYGEPRGRNPELVAEDVSEGWITGERAQQVYGASEAAVEEGLHVAANAVKRAQISTLIRAGTTEKLRALLEENGQAL